jgi:hypothetical protein
VTSVVYELCWTLIENFVLVLTSFPHSDFCRDLSASHFAFGSSFGSSLSCASPGLILVSLVVIQSRLAVCCLSLSPFWSDLPADLFFPSQGFLVLALDPTPSALPTRTQFPWSASEVIAIAVSICRRAREFGADLIPQFTRSVFVLLILLFSLLASVTWSPMFLVDFHFLQSQVRSFSSGAGESSLFYVKCIWCSDFFLSLRSFSLFVRGVAPRCTQISCSSPVH